MRPTAKTVAPVLTLGLLIAGCSAKAEPGPQPSATAEVHGGDGVTTGPGVTDDTITLGALVPLSGPIGGLGQDAVAGVKLYFDEVNAAAGVCGREVVIEARDNKWDQQETLTQYTGLAGKVAAFANLSPGDHALTLKDRLDNDGLAVMAGSYDPLLLDVHQAFMPGSPYDVEAVNGIAYLIEQGVVAKGDTIGVIAYPVGIGAAVTKGVDGAAEHFGLTVEHTKIDSTAPDATAQVNALKQAGAKVIVMGTAGAAVVSAASVAAASDYRVTILATNLLSQGDVQGAAKDAILNHVVLVSNSAPFSSRAPAVRNLLAAWQDQADGRPISTPVGAGYLLAKVLTVALQQACLDGDLTPHAITAALSTVGKIDTEGLSVDLDYSTPGQPPSLETFVLRPDADADGGVVAVTEPFASDAARAYASARGYTK
ncbi:ABC transporter substrate-binding protein [Xylanimonas ulmi]|uniref:Amino acid/amide ABC transporter substrate-binding protein (HAAT family) n=1 Tax=Xylanimonas ulmi TaxID=228973 RepID=A0A4Q7M144_9MICO|nr:ABC transporter substrate-binding protein [Xylanibacterium ulmi]RZS61536.1 amino acid/amide ABC transporter substrate-binding protein (HAAT family) [Xylanibacterium ulmi]